MKISIVLLLIISIVWVNTGCEEDSADFRSGNSNTAPYVDAGEDLFVWSPLNGDELGGSYSDLENNVKEVSWAKISGPNSYTIENKNSLHTKVSGLEGGIYQFELTVTDNMNLYDKDTMLAKVAEISTNPNEIIFKDLVWIFPWYNNIEINNFVSNTPPGSTFKIFIQRDNDPVWKEVPPESGSGSGNGLYEYFIPTSNFYRRGSLYISYYGADVNDTPSVKIVY